MTDREPIRNPKTLLNELKSDIPLTENFENELNTKEMLIC